MEPTAEILFPTIIWKSQIKTDTDALKRHILKIYDTQKGVSISNAGGWQSESQDISKDFIDLRMDLDKQVKAVCVQAGLPPLKLYNLWFNVNPPKAYNMIHNHHGAILSGVYYVDVPEGCGSIEFYRDDDSEYYIPPLESYNAFTSQKKVLSPQTEQLVLFPGWLRHGVQANNSNKDRISISFNYGVR